MEQKQRRINADYLMRLYPGQDEKFLLTGFYKKKYRFVFLIMVSGLVISLMIFVSDFSNHKIMEDGTIARNGYDGKSNWVDVIVKSEEYDDIALQLEVSHQVYSESEIKQAFAEAKKWLSKEILLENTTFERIETDLFFPDYYEPSNIELSYTISNYELLESNGVIHNEDIDAPENVTVYVEFLYEDYSDSTEFELTIFPKIRSGAEAFEKAVSDELHDRDELQQTQDKLSLPNLVEGKEIQFSEPINKRFLYFILLSIIAAVFTYKGMDSDLRKQYEKRKEDLLYLYPDFVSKLALLIGAGMSLTGAIRRIHAEGGTQKTPLYEELTIFVHSLDNGMIEGRALQNLGLRTGLPQYRKFCSLLNTSLKKGSINLKIMLQDESEAAFILHRAQIKKLGEEAGTKLLIPMVMMLAVVIAIIMIPAFLTYQIN